MKKKDRKDIENTKKERKERKPGKEIESDKKTEPEKETEQESKGEAGTRSEPEKETGQEEGAKPVKETELGLERDQEKEIRGDGERNSEKEIEESKSIEAGKEIEEKKNQLREESEMERWQESGKAAEIEREKKPGTEKETEAGKADEKSQPSKEVVPVTSPKKTDPKSIIIGMAVVSISLLLIACIYFMKNAADSLSARAVVEAPVVTFVSPVQGIVLEVSVKEGDWVSSGSALAVLDSEVQEKTLAELEEDLKKKEAVLAELLKGPDPKEITRADESVKNAQKAFDTAEAAYETADAAYRTASAGYDSAVANRDALKILYEEGATPETDYQNAEQAISDAQELMQEAEKTRENEKKIYDMAKSRLEYAKDRLTEIKAGPDPKEVRDAESAVAEIQDQIDKKTNEIKMYTLQSDCDGIVTKINYKKGDIVAIGYKVFEITLQEEAYLSAFLPERDLEKINLGQSVRIGDGQREYEGTVVEIGEEPQAVPEALENAVDGNQDYYRVKIETEAIGRFSVGETTGVAFPFHQEEVDSSGD